MIFGRLIFVLCLAAVCPIKAEKPEESLPGVVDLTPDNFDEVIDGSVYALVEFYAPWCGHCKSLTPEYKKLGAAIQEDPKLKAKVVVGKVNADAHRSLGERFGVRGFPTLKWFSRRKPANEAEDYKGGRNSESMLKFIEEKLEEDKGYGRIEALDSLIKDFASDMDGTIKAVEEKVKELVGNDQESGSIYLKLMNKAKEKGAEYFQKERERVGKIISSGSVTKEKLEEMAKKVSILQAFVHPEE